MADRSGTCIQDFKIKWKSGKKIMGLRICQVLSFKKGEDTADIRDRKDTFKGLKKTPDSNVWSGKRFQCSENQAKPSLIKRKLWVTLVMKEVYLSSAQGHVLTKVKEEKLGQLPGLRMNRRYSGEELFKKHSILKL